MSCNVVFSKITNPIVEFPHKPWNKLLRIVTKIKDNQLQRKLSIGPKSQMTKFHLKQLAKTNSTLITAYLTN